MLRRRGCACDVRFGVRRADRHALAAHAWVEYQGSVVYGSFDCLAEYSVLSPILHVPRENAAAAQGAPHQQ
jgi:hypothetical protein